MEDVKTQDDLLSKLVAYFDEAEQSSIDSRNEAEQSRDYYDGKQLTDAQYDVLNKRKQPPVIDNKVKDKVDTLLGTEIATRTDPKAFPRTPAHEGAAEAATDAIRFVADNNNMQMIKSEVGNNMFVEGTGASSVTINKETGEIDVSQIMWDRWFYDPHSRRKDYADAKYLGEAIWMDLDDAKRRYGSNADEFDLAINEAQAQYGETYADKPISKWVDPNRKRVRVVEIYYREDVWKRALIGRYSIMENGKPSPYFDDLKRPIHPYVARSAYVDRNGNRYGVIRRYKDLQDEHNKRRSKLLHLASNRNIVMDAGAVDNIEQARSELNKPDGIITVNPGKKFEVLDNQAEISAHTQLLILTDNALSETGPNSAIQGTSGRISGRAKQIDQQAGTVNLGTLFDGLRDWELRVYRKIWNCIQQFWDDERWVRVRDDERNLKFVSLNHKKTQGEAYEELLAEAEKTGGPPPPPPENPNAPLIDANGNPIIENDVVNLDVDIIIEQAPDIVTIQQEQFAELTQLASSGMVQIPPDILIEASTLRNKRQLLAQMRGENPEAQQQKQMQQMLEGIQMILAQLAVEEKKADIDKTVSEAEENRAQAELHAVEAFRVGEGEESVG